MTKELEHNIQAAFVDWVLWEYMRDPTFIRKVFFSPPNGAYLGGKSPATFQKLKKEGFEDGVSDILYLQPRGEWAYLTLEFKIEERRNRKRGGLSEDQEEFLSAVDLAGGLPLVCYGLDEAIEYFRDYMNLLPRVKSGSVIQSRGPELNSEEPRP